MDPDDVAKKYLDQAEKLNELLIAIESQKYTEEEYRCMVKMLIGCYQKLLMNLATYTPMLKYYVTIFNPKALESGELDLKNPPFDEKFFNSRKL